MRFITLAAAILLASAAAAQEIYIVELTGAPAAVRGGVTSKGIPARAALKHPQQLVAAEQREMRRAVESGGARVLASVDTVSNALIVRMTKERAAAVVHIPGVRHVHAAEVYKPALDHAVVLQKVTDAWARLGGSDNAGPGTKIGIIDTGIDVDHPGFSDAGFSAPAGYPLVDRDVNLRFTNNKIVVARSYDSNALPGSAADKIGHGTAVAMVAAGVTNTTARGTITGIAPKAFLGNYKVFPDGLGGAPTQLIIQALDDAVKDGMDVVNLSLGSFPARVVDRDPLVEAVETATAAGLVVVIAAGNSGPDPNTIESPGTSPDAITVGNAANDRLFGAQATADDGRTYRIYPGNGANSSSPIHGVVVDVAKVDRSGQACSELPAGSLNGVIALILRGNCTFEAKLNNAARAGAMAAIVYTNDQPVTTMAVVSATLPAVMVSNDDGQDIKAHVAADASWALTVSFAPIGIWTDPVEISPSSSRGPSADDNLKPDLAGVGSNILTAAPLSGGTGFTVVSGTSLSAPMVTGAIALLKAARPGLAAQQYRSLVINSTSDLNPDWFDQFPVLQNGSGLLNLSAALNSTIAASPVSIGFGVAAGTVDLSRTLTITNLASSPDTLTLGVVPFNGSIAAEVSSDTVQLDPGASKDVTVRFHAPIPAPGEYQGHISIHSSLSSVDTRVPYWFGVPSKTPANITILRGPEVGSTSGAYFVWFRVTDSAGIPVTDGVDVSIQSGPGRVTAFGSIADEIPGAFEADVRAGGSPTVVKIQAGDRSVLVSFPAR